MLTDEDEVVEVSSFGGERTWMIQVGLDAAMARVRSSYIAGRIEVEQFEAEVERLLAKRQSQ
jgi:hypothetical protein